MKKTSIITFLLLFSLVSALQAQLCLPRLVSDGMVLQRGEEIKVWGWANAGDPISLQFKGKIYKTNTSTNGQWSVMLKKSKAGGPYSMQISSPDEQIELNDVLVGDVWFCAGQSNMVHYLGRHSERYAAEIKAANYPEIRQFLTPSNPVFQGPENDLPRGEWKQATPENVLAFSVVGYFFAKNLYDQYQVPIGFINSSYGGTPIEAWISEEGFKDFPSELKRIAQNKDTAYVNRINQEAQESRAAAEPQPEDQGLSKNPKWYDPAYLPTHWHDINIPGYWEDQGIRNLNGTVWYRKEIELPKSMVGKAVKLAMGRIVDADEVYVNGQRVGGTGYQYPQRRYDIKAGVLKAGKNLITIRVTNYGGKGGFVPDKPYYLATAGDTLDLKGTWQYKVGQVFHPQKNIKQGIAAQYEPTTLYNGMVAPFVDFPVRGILWYQGESNAGNPKAYEGFLKALIADWRVQWDKELPFLYAQLPNYMEVNYSPEESGWAELRESQRKALSVPNTTMAVTLELGEWNDIHPGNKKPISDRLALAAKALNYGEKNMVYAGPMYRSASVNKNVVTLSFDHVGGGLMSKDGEALRWFALAGADKKYYWAQAKIVNDQVLLTSPSVTQPIYVRYAWMDNPQDINFYNQEGLPASPFEAQIVDKLWYGRKAGVVLTYDDALDVQLDNAIPVLDSLGLKATFYITANASKPRMYDWKRVAQNGHELGNHTLYHPCLGGEGREWVSPENDLRDYNTAEIVREIEMTDLYLQALDGKSSRTFAYTCGDKVTGEGSFIPQIQNKFTALRGVESQLNYIESIDFTDIKCFGLNGQSAEEMIQWAKNARAENALLVILFHGVGGGHSLDVSLEAHREFLEYLKAKEEDYWVTTMEEAAQHCKEQKQRD